MDELYVQLPYEPAATIHRRLRAWDRERKGDLEPAPPPKAVFCGARGSGKSTQLRRLAQLGDREWEWLLLDLAQVLPDRTSTLQIVAQAGLAILARLAEWEPNRSRAELIRGLTPARDLAGALRVFTQDVDLVALVEAVAPIVTAGTHVGAVGGAVVGAASTVLGATFTSIRDRRC